MYILGKRLVYLAVLATFLQLSCACSPSKRPFLIVQLCLKNDQGVAQFLGVMHEIASVEHMEFVDNSINTHQELEIINKKEMKVGTNAPIINIGVQRDDGVGVSAGNMGLAPYQVALGFSEGSDPLEGKRFATLVITQLERYWPVEHLPSDSGVLPSESCP